MKKSMSNSLQVLLSFESTIGGFDQFYSIGFTNHGISLQGKYQGNTIKNVATTFKDEILAQNCGWNVDGNNNMSIEIKYADTTLRFVFTD